MDKRIHRFKVGEFECAAVSDGDFVYAPPLFPPPAHFLFANASEEALREAVALAKPAGWNQQEWVSSYTCLLVKTGPQVVLVDTGAGGLGPHTGRLLENLALLDLEPGDVHFVILTHAHPDHLGGNRDAGDAPAFPKARWIINRAEWQFWMGGEADKVLPDHARMLLHFAEQGLAPLAGRIELLTGDEEVVPGIRLLSTPGHTPGHTSVAICFGDEELLCVADLVLHPLHLQHPEWVAAVDLLPEQLVHSRQAVLDRACTGGSLVMAFHFPFPGLGLIRAGGLARRWEPASELQQ